MEWNDREAIEADPKKAMSLRVIINSFEEAKEYIDMGVRDFCVGSDLGTLYRWCTLNGEKMREFLADV